MTQQVLDAYATGEINDATAATALAKLVVVDSEGDQWTIGAKTRTWYRRSAGLPWASATPPTSSVEVTETVTFGDIESIVAEAASGPSTPDTDEPTAPEPTPPTPEPAPAPYWDVVAADDDLVAELLGPAVEVEDPLGAPPGLTVDGIGGHSRHIRNDRAPGLVDLDPADLELLEGSGAELGDSDPTDDRSGERSGGGGYDIEDERYGPDPLS